MTCQVWEHTFELEGEVVSKLSALVVPPKKEQRVGVPDLERPYVENNLEET